MAGAARVFDASVASAQAQAVANIVSCEDLLSRQPPLTTSNDQIEVFMVRELYSLIMSPEKNPLAALPKPVAFQLMTSLAWLWSLVFSFWVGSLALFGPSATVHVILLVGVFFTADIFAKARKQKIVSYDMLFKDRRDGCARYDDVWGAP